MKSDELPERIENKIYKDPNSGCWIWTGSYSNIWEVIHRYIWRHV